MYIILGLTTGVGYPVSMLFLGEDFLPFVIARGAVEGGEGEHQHLSAHAQRQQEVAAGEVENLEERAPDHDGRTDRVCEIEETLPFLRGYPGREAALILLVFSH